MPRPRPGSRRACPTASRAISPGSSASPRWSWRRPRRSPPRSSRTWPSSSRSGPPGWPPSSGSGRACRPDCPVVADAKRGRHQLDRGPPGDRPVRPPRSRRRDRQSVCRRRGRSRRFWTARIGSPTSCAGPRTRAPASSRTWWSRRTRRTARRPSRSIFGWLAGWRPGARAGRWGWSSGPRRPSELRAIRDTVPGLAFLVPGIGAQGGDLDAVLAARAGDGRARAPGGPVEACSSTSPGGSPEPRCRPRHRAPIRPGGAPRGGRARLGGAAPCATLAARIRRPRASRPTPRNRCQPSAGAPTIMPTPGPLELVIILVIALLILGPGKLPDVGAALGKSIREFRKASSDVQDAVKVNVDTSPLPTTVLSCRRPPVPPTRPRPTARAGRASGGGAAAATRPRSPSSRHALRRPWLTPTRCARPASRRFPRDPGPAPSPPPGGGAAGRLGHVAHRSPRRAAHAPLPLDPGGRRRRRSRVYVVGPDRDHPASTPMPSDSPL